MKPLQDNDVESELSYAYIHAVAAHAQVACSVGSRHEDNAGVDARLLAGGYFGPGCLTEVDISVQLKATVKAPTAVANTWSYSLSGIDRYDALRCETLATPRILVVLFLPPDKGNWLSHSHDELLLRKCAYWVSLRRAPASDNQTAQTVYLPQSQPFDSIGLNALIAKVASGQVLDYKGALG